MTGWNFMLEGTPTYFKHNPDFKLTVNYGFLKGTGDKDICVYHKSEGLSSSLMSASSICEVGIASSIYRCVSHHEHHLVVAVVICICPSSLVIILWR